MPRISEQLFCTGFEGPLLISKGLPDRMRTCRAAWCYGDPGIGVALLWAARETGDAELEKTALEVAWRVVGRPYEKSQVQEPGLCHGAAGLALIYNRFYQATRD